MEGDMILAFLQEEFAHVTKTTFMFVPETINDWIVEQR